MSILDELNEEQRTVTYRIAHMIKEKGISPLNIMALTFTNKAAKEMKERAEALIGPDANNLVVSTFHSFSVRLLKTYSDRIGYGRNFNIYDVDDQKTIINKIKKDMNIKNDDISPAKTAGRISKLKEQGIGIEELEEQIDIRIPANRIFRDIYQKYDETLKANNAMDFSDLLLNAKKLLEDPYVLERVQDRYRYIVVDEYQDTNDIQYEIISKIAEKYKNICVVGKKLWTNGEKGEKIKVFNAPTVYDEAEFIVNEIKAKSKDGKLYKDMTILYRTNSQSRVLEEKLLAANVPYKIYGGMQFFQRKEIKDILAYLNLLNNPNDNHNFYRIINVPKRSIGDKTLEKLGQIANEKGISMLESTKYIDEIPGIRSSVKEAAKDFYKMMHEIYENLDELSIKEVFDEVLIKTKYIDSIEDNKEDRVKNIEELLNSITESERQNPGMSLSEYLDMVSLTSSTDDIEDEENFIKLMTIHSSKGLEFDYVFIAGMEDGLFPSCNFDTSEEEIEEERRLCYVAVTRAKKELYISHVSERMVWGQMNYMIKPSRFIYEMKQGNLEYLSEKFKSFSKKMENATVVNKETRRKIENFNPFSLKSVRTSELKNKGKSKYKVGDTVDHIKFGKGKIKKVDEKSLVIDFMTGEKKIALILAEKLLKG